ncbi:MAG: anaerobic sulfatase maturase, partial [Bacteroidota bacterium]
MKTTANRPFSLLLKPAAADCNLRCQYCFYLGRAGLYPETIRHRMTDAVLERVVSSYMATVQPRYAFGWQGGEPTLMGAAFFRRAAALQAKYGRRGSVVANGLQTNATLLDDELCAVMAEYNFLAGVSLDGPPDIHDHYRRTIDGKGTYAATLQGMNALRRHGVEFNVLTLVTAVNQERGAEVYRHLRDLGLNHHQYIPCVEWQANGVPAAFSVSPAGWGRFLLDVFEEWYARDVGRVSVRLFDALLVFLAFGVYELCHLGGDCRRYFVIEHNGDVYPCDFFVARERLLGNIMDHDWDFFLQSTDHAGFSRLKTEWPEPCRECDFLAVCSGDCLKHRLFPGSGAGSPSRLCEGWRFFFQRALPRLEDLAARLRNDRGLPARAFRRPGRNEPCFCGSGR